MPKKKTPTVPVDDRLGEMLNWAVRYCLGRRTYAPHDTMEYCKPLIPHLSNRTLWCMQSDIKEAIEHEALGDPIVDAPAWKDFYKLVCMEIERRDAHENA